MCDIVIGPWEGFSAGAEDEDDDAGGEEEGGGDESEEVVEEEDLDSLDEAAADASSSAGTSIFEMSSPSSASIAMIFPTGTFLAPS